MAATAHELLPPLDDILDDPNPRGLMELLDRYKDATTAQEASLRLDELFTTNPDKFFLKLALIFKSSTAETRLEMLSHLHNFFMRNNSCLKSTTLETIKNILLAKVQCEDISKIQDALCNMIADVAPICGDWCELVTFIDKSLNITSVGNDKNPRHEKVCLDIIAKHPQVLSNTIQHEAISKSLFRLLSTSRLLSNEKKTSILAVQATIELVGSLESKNRNPYKKLIPKIIPVLQYMAKEPGPKKQESVVGDKQHLVDRYIHAAKLFETFVDMDDIGFFVTDKKHLTNFIKLILMIGRTKLLWLRLRHSCLRLAAKFCSHRSIDMSSYYLDIYKILIDMLIEVEDVSERWYELDGDDVEGTKSNYTSAKGLIDEFIPAIGAQAFLTAVFTTMAHHLEIGEWRLQNGVLVILTKLAIHLKNEKEGASKRISLNDLLDLARKPLRGDNPRLHWTWANAIGKVGDIIKQVHPSSIKSVSSEVVAKLDGLTTEQPKLIGVISLARVVFSTEETLQFPG